MPIDLRAWPLVLIVASACGSSSIPDVGARDGAIRADADLARDAGRPSDAEPDRADAEPGLDASASDTGGGGGNVHPGPRQGHQAVRLSDGRVLVTGGFGPGGDTTQLETFVFDPQGDRWSRGPDLPFPHQYGRLIATSDGAALLFGGCAMRGLRTAECHDRVDRVDVATGTVTLAGRLGRARAVGDVHRVTGGPLDGDYLVLGGTVDGDLFLGVEAFDPSTGLSTDVASLTYPSPRYEPAVVPLADGRVLIAGGYRNPGSSGELDTALVLDPVAQTIAPTGAMVSRRGRARGVTLADGTALILHGREGVTVGAEIYDPAAGTFARAPHQSAITDRFAMELVRLDDGRVLVIGGSTTTPVDEVYVYDPQSGYTLHPTRLERPVGAMTATLLEDGRVLLVGGQSPGGAITAPPQIFVP